jgi:hypothetical protein
MAKTTYSYGPGRAPICVLANIGIAVALIVQLANGSLVIQ